VSRRIDGQSKATNIDHEGTHGRRTSSSSGGANMLLSMVMHAWCLLLYRHCMLIVVFSFCTAWFLL
jgi:hypothetical protein